MSELTDDEVFERLSAPIPPDELKSRQGSRGEMLRYIKVTTVINRLDSACGPGNWSLDTDMAERWVRCRLTINLPSGKSITRDGIGGYPEMPKMEDQVKGGATDALKRAGALFGIGLNLYDDADTSEHVHIPPNPTGGYPQRQYQQNPSQRQQGGNQYQGGQRPQQGNGERRQFDSPPRSGRALFAWSKDNGKTAVINAIGKDLGFPDRMTEWTDGQVAQVYEEVTRNAA